MQVTLLEYTPSPELVIANAAAVCYQSPRTDEDNARRLKAMLSAGHLSPLRFAYATFHIIGISLVESHQHVRVAHAGILQRSYRYTEFNGVTITPPSFAKANKGTLSKLQSLEQLAFEVYEELLECGVPKEDARYILPQSITTELVMSGNFQMWLNWIKARTSPHAQWEIRAVATEISNKLATIAPNIFGELNANASNVC